MDWTWLLSVSRPVFDGFVRLEPRPWGPIGTVLELSAETGKLARAITIFEGYRHGRKSRHEMADELSDMLFVLCRFVYDLKLEPGPGFSAVQADSVEDAFFQIHYNIDRLHERLRDRDVDDPFYRRKVIMPLVEDIGGMVVWLAGHYKIDLSAAHLDEMSLASTYQRLFFDKAGRKKKGNKLAKLYRKVIWLKAAKLHQARLDKF